MLETQVKVKKCEEERKDKVILRLEKCDWKTWIFGDISDTLRYMKLT